VPLLGSELPLVAAPMAGGATTPALAAAVADAGAFPFLAGGYQSPEALAADIAALRSRDVAFGVNLFAPNVTPIGAAEYRRYASELQPDADRYGLDLSQVPLRADDDHWQGKLDVLLADPVPVVSVTFGLPRPADTSALRKAGTVVLVTVTNVEEARAAADAGADALVAQGSDAGGHSGTHAPTTQPTPTSTADLTKAVRAATSVPVIAAGGVAGPEHVTDLLGAGATAAAVGTLLLRTDESGASQTHKDALADPAFARTTVTHAFTGRPARGLHNAFIDRHNETAPLGYPAIHHLTRALRRAAAETGRPDDLHLWAGTGYRQARTGPAAGVIETLAAGL